MLRKTRTCIIYQLQRFHSILVFFSRITYRIYNYASWFKEYVLSLLQYILQNLNTFNIGVGLKPANIIPPAKLALRQKWVRYTTFQYLHICRSDKTQDKCSLFKSTVNCTCTLRTIAYRTEFQKLQVYFPYSQANSLDFDVFPCQSSNCTSGIQSGYFSFWRTHHWY